MLRTIPAGAMKEAIELWKRMRRLTLDQF